MGIEGSKRDHRGVMGGHRGVMEKYLTNIRDEVWFRSDPDPIRIIRTK